MTLSNNSRILFVLLAGTQSVASFRIWRNSNLTPVDTASGLPLGTQGIAAKIAVFGLCLFKAWISIPG